MCAILATTPCFFCCPSGKSCHPWCKISNVLVGNCCTNCLCCAYNFATRVAVFHIFARFLHTLVCFAQRRCMRAFFCHTCRHFWQRLVCNCCTEYSIKFCDALLSTHCSACNRTTTCLPCLLHGLLVARVLSKQLCFPLCSSICWQFFSVNSRCGCFFFVATSAITLFFKFPLMPTLCLANVATSAVVFCWWCVYCNFCPSKRTSLPMRPLFFSEAQCTHLFCYLFRTKCVLCPF